MRKLVFSLVGLFVFGIALFPGLAFAKTDSSANGEIPTTEEIESIDREKIISELSFGERVTEEEIRKLDDVTLYELSKDEGYIVSVEETGSMLHQYLMPRSDFEMSVVAQRIWEKDGDNFKFVATGDWKTSPFWELKDSIGLAWTDGFTLYQDYSYIKGYAGINQYLNPGVRIAVDGEKGVAHEVDLRVGATDDKAVLVAKVNKGYSTGTANVVGEYAHVEIRGSVDNVSFSIGDSPQVTFSGSAKAVLNEASPAYDYFSY